MQPTPRLLRFAEEVAQKVSTRNRLDPDAALSAAYWLAIEAAGRTELELDSLCLLNTYLTRRLIPMILDETTIFGPVTGTIRQRRYANEGDTGQIFRRWPSEVLQHATVKSEVDDFDFLERFTPRQQQFILLLIAGYTYTELGELGFTRHEITVMKGVLESVYMLQ